MPFTKVDTKLFKTGEIKFSDLRSNFKDTTSGSISFSELYRSNADSAYVPDALENLNIPTSGTIQSSNFRNSIKELKIVQGASDVDENITTNSTAIINLFNSYNKNRNVRKTIEINGTLGATTSIDNGAFYHNDSGYKNLILLISSTGKVYGKGGSGASGTATDGGNGGNAIKSLSALSILNNGLIYAGGGGGGKGGEGGLGGTGGSGSYSGTQTLYRTWDDPTGTQGGAKYPTGNYGAGGDYSGEILSWRIDKPGNSCYTMILWWPNDDITNNLPPSPDKFIMRLRNDITRWYWSRFGRFGEVSGIDTHINNGKQKCDENGVPQNFSNVLSYAYGSFIDGAGPEDAEIANNGTKRSIGYNSCSYTISYNYTTSGGSGGAGGSGGTGGKGRGYDYQSPQSLAGSSGSSGSSGSAGGTNAGTGGSGGQGGTGGSGGDWGTAGSSGATGINGNNGSSGNVSSGSAGGSGSSGGSGGAAGYYIYGVGVTFTNNGTVKGQFLSA